LVFVLWCCVLLPSLSAAGEPSLESIQSRISELSKGRVRSTSGRFLVIGTNRLENVALAAWSEDIAERIETITGIPVPRKDRMIRVVVGAGSTDVPGGVAVRHRQQGKTFVHSVHLSVYASAYEPRGRQALCLAILARYVDTVPAAVLSLPPWLWKGIERNLSARERAQSVELALALWRSGKLISIRDIVGDTDSVATPAVDDDPQRLAAYGAFVHWLTALPLHRDRFKAVFDHVISGTPITVARLAPLVSLAGRPARAGDEAWDRWLMKQEHVVYAPGSVSTRAVDQLRSELLIYSGVCGIPLEVALPRGSTVFGLIPYRKHDWIPRYVRQKRSRLALLASGRANAFQSNVAQFGDFLLALEGAVPDTILVGKLNAANAALARLTKKVEAAGGILAD
jgi:hypothetical protein